MTDNKTCSRCRLLLPLSAFYEGKRAGGHQRGPSVRLASECIECTKAYTRAYQEKNKERIQATRQAKYAANKEAILARQALLRAANPAKMRAHQQAHALDRKVGNWQRGLYYGARSSSKLRGIVCEIDASFIQELYERQWGKCFWLNIPLIPAATNRDPQRPSLDRYDPAIGYTRENTVLACTYANFGRSNSTAARTFEFLALLRCEMRYDP